MEDLNKKEEIKKFLTIGIDTEADKSHSWRFKSLLQFLNIEQGIVKKVAPIFYNLGISPTYFLSPEVLEDLKSIKILQGLKNSCEFGTHLHAELIEPQRKIYNNVEGKRTDEFQIEYSPEIEKAKLEKITLCFRQIFGYNPSSFRAGRFAIRNETFKSLIELGYSVDSSITPHKIWKRNTYVIDYRDSFEQPYFPSEKNFLLKGDLPILEVPVSIVKVPIFKIPLIKITKTLWLRPWFSTVNQMKKLVNYILKKYQLEEIIVLNMMFHSNELIPKASPYPQTQSDVNHYIKDIEEILIYILSLGFKSLTFAKVADFYLKRIKEAKFGSKDIINYK